MRPGNLGLETAKANAMISVYYANVDLSIMHQATDPTSSSQGESMERQECMLRGTLGLKFSISTCVLSRRRTQVSCLHTLGLADKNIEGNRRERLSERRHACRFAQRISFASRDLPRACRERQRRTSQALPTLSLQPCDIFALQLGKPCCWDAWMHVVGTLPSMTSGGPSWFVEEGRAEPLSGRCQGLSFWICEA